MNDRMAVYEEQALTASDMKAQVNRIQEVMRAVMQDGQHYGKVPGCGDKLTLLKPGAEKLMMTFRLAADPQVESLPCNDGMAFRVTCRLTHQATGIFLGSGVGECSTKEDKYNWRGAVSEAEWNATPEDRKRIKYGRDYQTKQIRTNPADLANTVLKMAKKRALVDGVLTVTGASDIFTQDLDEDEIPTEGNKPSGKPSTTPPGKKEKKEPVAGEVSKTSGLVESVTVKEVGKEKPLMKYTITILGEAYGTLSKSIAENAKAAKDMALPVQVEYTTDKYGHTIQSLTAMDMSEGKPGAGNE